MLKRIFVAVLPLLAMGLQGEKSLAGDLYGDTLPPAPALRGEAPDPSMGNFGNTHAGIDAYLASDGSFVPMINVGAKYAYEGGVGAFGFQVDSEIDYAHSLLASSDLGGATVGVTAFDFAAHATFMPSNDSKIGAFIGAAGLNSSGLVPASNTSTYLGYSNISNFKVTTAVFGAGIEGLYSYSDSVVFQTRMAVLGPSIFSASGQTATGAVNNTAFILNNPIGLSVMAGASKRFSNNISARVDANYLTWPALSQSNLQASVTGQYNLDEEPIALGATVGYDLANVSGLPTGAAFAKMRATYSFGGPSFGASGKLFRSGILGLLN